MNFHLSASWGNEMNMGKQNHWHAYTCVRLYLLMSMLFTVVSLFYDSTFGHHFFNEAISSSTTTILSSFFIVIAIGLYDTLTSDFRSLNKYVVDSISHNRHVIYMVLALFICLVTSAIVLTIKDLNSLSIARYFLDGVIATIIAGYDIFVKMTNCFEDKHAEEQLH